MTKTLKKNIWRSITGSFGRYLAILLIIMLGVAFLTGLRLTRPAMIQTATDYLKQTSLYDLYLVSTIGFDEEDVTAAGDCDGVTAAEGSVSSDFLWTSGEEDRVLQARTLTSRLNLPDLQEGRLPQAGNECVVDADRFTSDMIGQTIRLSDANNQDTLDLFAYDEYTVVGLVHSPLYLDVDRGTSSLGDGTVDAFVLIPPEGFDSEYFTELYVKCADYPLYSDEYDNVIDQLTDAVEPAVTGSVQTRFDDLVRDAEQEISDGEQELADKQAEAQTELDDAKAELDDAQTQLDDARAELERGQDELDRVKAQLDDAKAELDAGAEQIQSGFTSWDGALEAGWAAYNDGKAQLEAAIAEGQQLLSERQYQMEAAEQAYSDGMAQLEAGQTQYDQGLALWQQGYDQYTAALSSYEQNYAAYETAQAQYQQALEQFNAIKDTLPPDEAARQEAALEQTQQTLEQTSAALAAGKAELDASNDELTAQKAQLDATAATLADSRQQLSDLRTTLDEGWSQYNAGVAELENQQTTQQAALDSAYNALVQFQEGVASYRSGLASYNDGVDTLEEGWQTYYDSLADYQDGLSEYEDGVAEFDQEIADAEDQLADARADLADLEDPELYVLSRSESNSGYVTFESDSTIVQRLSTIFPIFFFLIAALVCSTTMTRMVDDDRTQIGTMRALGYSRGAILSKYLLYSGSAATIGCLIGYFGGGWLFPAVIWIAYKMLYNIPGFICTYDPVLFVLSLAASLLCSAGVTYLSCRHEMRSTPADLIRPKAPAAGKRILLERFTPLWRRLKFLHKVSLRNIFRFKKRMFMMLLGIAGCTALVLTGFGIRDSVANIANYQFDDIQKYDLSVSTSDPITQDWLDHIQSEYGGQIDAQAVSLMSAGELTGSETTKSVYFVASDDEHITDIFDLHLDGRQVPYPGEGEVLISEKLSQLAGVRVGDTVTISISDEERADVRVVGLVENYVQNYVYMTGTTYASAFGSYEPETLLIRAAEGEDEYSLSAALANENGVASISVITDTRNMIDNMMRSLDYVVALVLASAAALAFIVMFNLGNINISERVREIATIKVLGFHSRETGAYVFRENLILCCMGILIGLPLGFGLHHFVMDQIQVDMVSFKYVIKPVSYLLTVAIVLLFSIITDLILRRKIARIDMAESLKSIE